MEGARGGEAEGEDAEHRAKHRRWRVAAGGPVKTAWRGVAPGDGVVALLLIRAWSKLVQDRLQFLLCLK